ncbi:protocatechuate 3,4-dioxygenase subunit beta [Taklimakanibacter deserti]|uniref:protocatechuate 3,4-dioxygenase subunit beta n=1 Tax=Taklimakanibacter deserti TaxID=2267839 RepID=UPI000E64828B
MTSTSGGRDWMAHPPLLYPAYRSTVLRAPAKPLVPLKQALSKRSLAVYGHGGIGPDDHDLTRNARRSGEPLGERIIVSGRVLDERGRPIPQVLIELWQANAAGRYIHKTDQHQAPLDPNFFGGGRCVTDTEGRYRFLTVRPGAYPWGNHANAWRPSHIHFSLLGSSIVSRLVTQMYFPGDPLVAHDPIFQGTPEKARERLISRFSLAVTEEGFALGYDFDIVLRGSAETPFEGR